MNRPALCQLPVVDSLPSSEVGPYLKSLSILFERDVPVVPLVCVPTETLLAISKLNSLHLTLTKFIKDAELHDSNSRKTSQDKLIQIFKKQNLPSFVRHQLHADYHDYLHGGFVTLFPSIATERPLTAIENCQGDANVIESLLETWAKSCFSYLLMHPHATPAELILHTGIVIQYQPQSEFSGVAYTMNPDLGNKTSIKILGIEGVSEANSANFSMTWLVDIRTGHILAHEQKIQSKIISRKSDGLKSKEATSEKKAIPNSTISALANYIIQAKRQFLQHKKIHWSIEQNRCTITGIESYEYEFQPRESTVTITKLFAANPTPADRHLISKTDGAFISSNQLFMEQSVHPMNLSEDEQSLLSHQIMQNIVRTSDHLPKKSLVFYQLHTLTSAQLKTLRGASTYETQEENPTFGLKGVSRYLEQKKVVDIELQAVLHAVEKTELTVGLVIPFARTATEMKQFLESIKQTGVTSHPKISLYLQIMTPSNVKFLSSFPVHQFAGVITDIYNLHALETGIDPNNSLMQSLYPLDSSQCIATLETIQKSLRILSQLSVVSRTSQNIILFDGQFHDHIARKAISLGATGILVKPQVVPLAKACIIDVEGAPWQK
ncbi:MAG: putative PEP-binding protein [Microgenomates group bacterium]